MTREQREYIKSQLSSYVESITQPSRVNRGNQYNCPLCKSGTGKNRTGAFFIKDNRYKCFSCGNSGDIFDLISAYEGILPNSRELFERAGKIFNMESVESGNRTTVKEKTEVWGQPEISAAQSEIPNEADYTEYIKKCAYAAQNSVIAKEYLKGRGLSQEIFERYSVGYDPNYTFTTLKGKQASIGQSIIIPYPNTNNGYFIVRSLDPPKWFTGKYKKLPRITEPLFNIDILYSDNPAPCFIVEGQIDALSVMEAGADAIAINSTSGRIKLIKQLEAKPTARSLALYLDNDSEGRVATEKLRGELNKLCIPYITVPVSIDPKCKYKDPNEALANKKDFFLDVIYNAQIMAVVGGPEL